MSNEVVLHTDGAARGNPGPAGIGVVVEMPRGQIVQRIARALGKRTNNQAEYEAVLVGLRAAQSLGARQLTLMLDSELVAKQLRGEYRVKDVKLKALFDEAKMLLAQFARVRIVHVPRARNADADKLANEGIERGMI
ncbi:MAG: ribonuclease HI family protein [Chloroflexi bacterium]|nr:ribonuclease HI family protein [Chloroflexota bacterium]